MKAGDLERMVVRSAEVREEGKARPDRRGRSEGAGGERGLVGRESEEEGESRGKRVERREFPKTHFRRDSTPSAPNEPRAEGT